MAKRRKYTKEQIKQLEVLYKTHTAKECAEILGMPVNVITNLVGYYKLSTPQSRLKSKLGQYRKGHRPANTVEIGSETLDTLGYIRVKVGEPNEWDYKQRVVWKEHNGDIPDGYIVTFIDNNINNYDINNLELMKYSDLIKNYSFNNYPIELRTAINLTNKFKREIKKYE